MSKEELQERLKDIREEIKREEEARKEDNAYYASLVRDATNEIEKFNYRSLKKEVAWEHDMQIEQLKLLKEKIKIEIKLAK